jgi:hypothetical protein
MVNALPLLDIFLILLGKEVASGNDGARSSRTSLNHPAASRSNLTSHDYGGSKAERMEWRARSLPLVSTIPLLLRVVLNEALSARTTSAALRCLLAMLSLHPAEYVRLFTKSAMAKMALILQNGSNRLKSAVLQLVFRAGAASADAGPHIQHHRSLGDAIAAIAAQENLADASPLPEGGLATREASLAPAFIPLHVLASNTVDMIGLGR